MSGSVLRMTPWVGGKGQLMWAIQPLIPVHIDKFIDVFAGGGTVTLNILLPRSCTQIYNDLNGNLYNLAYCIKNKPLALTTELNFLPSNSRAVFNEVKRFLNREEYIWTDLAQELELAQVSFPPVQAAELTKLMLYHAIPPDVRRAAAYYLSRQYSFNSQGGSYAVASCDIRRFFYQIWECSRRMKNVVLENKDFETIIRDNNDPKTMLYCDPPYYLAEKCYEVGFAHEDHQRLHDALVAHKGYFMVSYNCCEYIRELYKDCYIFHLTRHNSQSRQKDNDYEEYIITNYDVCTASQQTSMYPDFGKGERLCKLIHTPEHPLKAE